MKLCLNPLNVGPHVGAASVGRSEAPAAHLTRDLFEAVSPRDPAVVVSHGVFEAVSWTVSCAPYFHRVSAAGNKYSDVIFRDFNHVS